MHKPPFLSIIIPTFNRHNVICDTVNHLLKQDYLRYEIIVLDQTKNVPARITHFFKEVANKGVRYIHLDEPGLPNARNVGTKAARGEIIVFVDDDVEPVNTNYLKNHTKNYSDPQIVGVAGRVIDREYPVENNPDKILKLNKFGTFKEGKNGTVRTEVDTLPGNNMSFRKEDALKTTLFDTNIIGTEHGEEVNFCFNLVKKSGKKLVFDPTAVLYHLALPSGGDSSRSVPPLFRQFSRFHNLTLICLQNRDIINPALFLIGRVGAMLRIAVQNRNIQTFYWLTKAMVYGRATYRKKINPKDMIRKVRESFGVG